MPSTEEEWTVVTREDKRRVIRSGRRRAANPKTESDSNTWSDITRRRVVGRMAECKQALIQTSFFQTLKHSIMQKFVIRQIVCYGVGNLSTSASPSMWQLACALLLRESLQKGDDNSEIPLFFYDPLTTEQEAELMTSEWTIQVLSENERGKRRVDQSTLFFMPHCPLLLYGNVLWANWNCLENAVLFGNSLSLYKERALEKDKVPESVSLLLPFVEQERVDVSAKDAECDLEKAFNDSYLTWITLDDSDNLLPARPEEALGAEDDNAEVF